MNKRGRVIIIVCSRVRGGREREEKKISFSPVRVSISPEGGEGGGFCLYGAGRRDTGGGGDGGGGGGGRLTGLDGITNFWTIRDQVGNISDREFYFPKGGGGF